VSVKGGTDRTSVAGRAGSRVDRRELSENQPRSAPDALRYEPGVYVQQTGHGQGSPFVRGRTGQQVLLLVDGVRLNNSTFRQGPNQYFFTVDARSIHSIDVLRGGASTQYGSDALAGVINARPVEPTADPAVKGLAARPRVLARGATADGEHGFRLQLDAQYTDKLRFVGGFGSRAAGALRGSGPVCGPSGAECTQDSPEIALVPRLEADGRTQLGTGFREITADARLVYAIRPEQRLIAAAYLYRQYDSPRTEQCPPPYANRDECLTIDEQFRTLAYLSYRGEGPSFARSIEATLSFQRQHERRTRDRPRSFIENGGRDAVSTLGALFKAQSDEIRPLSWLALRLRYGADVYDDRLESRAWTIFTDNDILVVASRGQYIAGSAYTQGGAHADAEISLPHGVVVRGGARGGFAIASAPGDPVSSTLPVDQAWPIATGHAGVEVPLLGQLRAFVHYDRSFRTPNLDDLTSRQQAGPGFQLENAALRPETADTFEAGVRLDLPFLEADLWVFRSDVHDAILRASRPITACPAETPQCASSWARFQLVNLDGVASITGFEASARAFLPLRFEAKATVAFAFGEGKNPQERPSDPAIPYEETLPLSRIPPLNGTAELRWESPFGLYAGAALRWALTQDRLALTDRSDARIPPGGTPGFAVVDLRLGYKLSRHVLFALVVENVGDTPHRYHGSSINNPERGLMISLEGGL
jgi:outer membrane receptor protein involved in Fe transport